MSLNAITAAAVSGLQTAQTGLRTVSDNIANVDTQGYIRKVVDQSPAAASDKSYGVSVERVRLAADRFLQAASLSASSKAGEAGAAASLWDQAQGLFGDPTANDTLFATLDGAFAAFGALAAAPTSTAARAAALNKVQDFFVQAGSIADQIKSLQEQADTRISADVERVNQILAELDSLNVEVTRARILSNDSTGPENVQRNLIAELSKMMDIRVSDKAGGGVEIRAGDGMLLVGNGAAKLNYDGAASRGELWITGTSGQTQLLGSRLNSGELKGLLDLRNDELPGLSGRLSELVSKTADQLNEIHNSFSALPAPSQLTGRNTGLDLPTAITGFTGTSTVTVVNAAGVIQKRVDIDFTAGTLSVDGGAASAFTPANFLASLNTALGASGSASFANGALSISAAGGAGIAIADSAATPSDKAGRGFSAYFGLNDLVTASNITNYDTGLTGADAHGFTPGGQIKFRLTGPDGARLTDVNFTVPAAGTMTSLITALNAPVGGVGLYGSFALDATGQLRFTSANGAGVTLSVAEDATARGAGGPGMNAFFGLDAQTRAARASLFSVRSDIVANPAKLALAKLDLAAGPGIASLSSGDTRGADALSQAGLSSATFDSIDGLGRVTESLSDYAAGLAGHIARNAAAADTAKTSAEAIFNDAEARRTSVEGVNLDQELIQMTTYQQAYNASARMLQAAKEMYDVLLNMTN